ncbi:MAG: response regulator [Myxococcota bacterium]
MPHVLLIDDDEAFRALARAALEEGGIDVSEAAKGRDGLERFQAERFDAVIVDGLLPDTTGLRWIEAVRESGAMTPIVFVSAFFRDLESFRRLSELGVTEVVHKPIDPGDFARTVRSALPMRRRTSMKIDLSAIERELGALNEVKLEEPAPVHAHTPSTTMPLATDLFGPRVVILSDDEAQASFVRRSLEASLLPVEWHTSAELREGEAPDGELVILSLPFGRPGEAGLALEAFIERPRVAVIAATDAPGSRSVAEAMGADQFLVEPINATTLSAAVQHMSAMADRSPPRVLVWTQGGAVGVADALERETVRVRRAREWERVRTSLTDWMPHAVVIDGSAAGSLSAIRMSEGGAEPALIVTGLSPSDALFQSGASQVFEQASAATVARIAGSVRIRLAAAPDRLTRLPRRAQFIQALRARAAAARRARAPIAIAFVTIEGAGGLAARRGDEGATAATRRCAELIRARFRLEDLRGLWARDTFALAFPNTLGAQIAPAIARLQEEVGALSFEGVGGAFRISLAAGVSTLRYEKMTLRDAVEAAEAALRKDATGR